MLNLNIVMQSIELSNEIFSLHDKIRVSITTIPDNQKQAQIFDAKKLNLIQPSFKIQFNETTKKIIAVIRKKNYLEGDPILATTTIYTQNITNIFKEHNNNDEKRVNLYKFNKNTDEAPTIVGKINIHFSVIEEIQVTKSNTKNNRNNKETKKYNDLSKLNAFKKENEYLLLNDNFEN